ncbi:hypothetical protein [Streptomyces sp. NPDC002133]|uniref:hypothetical protein n=1 Tax=Streptomyces sp. NPDC002133 TaxID=3154409 RepID=UPI0033251631
MKCAHLGSYPSVAAQPGTITTWALYLEPALCRPLLADLRDAYAHTGRHTDFHQRLTRLHEDYQRRPGLIHRLDRRDLR